MSLIVRFCMESIFQGAGLEGVECTFKTCHSCT